MIEVEFDKTMLTVVGHAGSAPVGEDLVCAAASMLVGTLDASLRRLCDAGEIPTAAVCMHTGYACISCRDTPTARAVFAVILDGFQLLARKYPEYVTLKPEKPPLCNGPGHPLLPLWGNSP